LRPAGAKVHQASMQEVNRSIGCWPWPAVRQACCSLRERAESRFTPPVPGPRAPLTEVLVHEGDMRIPLGLPLEPDTSGVRIGLEFITTGCPIGFVPRGRLRGLRLVATDDNWEWGDGAEVHGRGIDLLMAACGRSSVLPALDGQGSKTLAERIPADF